MNNTINTDQPKSLKEHDRFQRYEFSKRIARLIDMNSSERSLVIGLYGKWGEGKTTVMNFIKRELPENCIVINFNPWFFSDQEKLIKAFFDTIAYELKLSIKTKKENIGKVLSDYGSVIGNVTKLAGISLDGVKEMGDKLNQVSTEELKGRVDGVIRASGKKIVVCVDDIDRLDVREVQCIFKLVKLVGDFCNTAYILAFDDEMVAGALAPLYGDGKTNNGYQFLEKIIQVPLKIPKAIKPALRDYTNEMLDNVFQDMELTLTMDEVNRYRNVFDENFLPVIDNPRLAIRYANALFFSLPLLVGEVCTTDVMLVEGLKVLFPGAYEFMRMNSALFITDNMRDRKSMFAGSPDKGTITTETGQFLAGFDKKQEKRVQEIWMALFPQYEYVCRNVGYAEDSWREWYKEKRICSGKYFERYFTYAVLEGDLSDVFFDQFLKELEVMDLTQAAKKMKLLFQDTAVKDVIFKMRLWEDSLPEIQSEKLSELLTHMGPELPIEEGEFSAYTTRAEGAKIIARLILNLSAERRVAHALNVFSLTDDMEFAMEICYWLFYKNEKETKKYFDAANEAEIHAYFLQRFKAAYFGKILVTDFSDSNLWRLIIWWSEADRAGLEEQLKVQLENDPLKAVQLIKVFTPTVQSWSNDGTSKLYKAGFGQTRYEAIDKLFNPAIIYNILAGTDCRVEDVKIDQLGDNDPLTDSQLANVFMYYYEYHHSSIGKF